MKQDDIVRRYFAKLGLEPEIANIYLALHTYGPQTISALARNANVERTKIYRLIDQLMASSLIEVEAQYKRGIIKAAPIANIRILITQREQELRSLQDDLEMIEQTLARNSLSNPVSRVQFYHGIEGLRQMQWNQISSSTELLGIIDKPLQHTLGKQFTAHWAEAINERNIRMRLIETPHFRDINTAWYQSHKIPELVQHVTSHVIDPSAFPVGHNTYIWDNVVAYYNWKDGDIYGIEIYNADIAATQRKFFEMLWETTPPTK
jgi:sugar-specific transcriptional regulator TrmB